jgi:hypothetical protein
LFLGTAGFLEVAELSDGPFELAREALGVEAEVSQGFGLVQETFDEVPPGVVEGEEVGFERDDAIEAPGDVGQRLDQMIFGGALGLVFVAEGFQMYVIQFAVFPGHDEDLLGVLRAAHGAEKESRAGLGCGAAEFGCC